MTKELDDFSHLFDFTPNIEILNLNIGDNDITEALITFVKAFNGSITTHTISTTNELSRKIKKSNYDYGIICNLILNSSEQNKLLEIISMGIRDSGYIIILEKKDKELDNIYALLEEFDYGAISSIDIFDKYNLIMGKKLHMWGMD